MSAATVTPVSRRTFGLSREVYAIRCTDCTWVAETRTPQTAEAIRVRHECEENT